MGWVSNFLATPVQRGFIHGIAVVVILGQIPRLLGIEVGEERFLQQLWSFVQTLPDTDPATAAVGFGSLTLLFILRKFAPRTPAALITTVVAIIVSTLLDFSNAGVAVVGLIEAGLPHLGIPDVSLNIGPELMLGSLAIILVGYTKSISGAKAAAERTGENIDPNQELIALGMANVGSGLSSGFVVAGSLLRLSVIRSANGRSQIVGLINAGLVILTLFFFTAVLSKSSLRYAGSHSDSDHGWGVRFRLLP
jgi:MFS superfamily sulfate permease-like transporter